ncbi:MAG TPA: aspartate carbamoyltransferase [Anaerolineaceae bacterium]|jgi:aspartate carbamoyltransferase|nr:aspartate carbamoyltransferase [Anaerolineaceae bacterium]HOH20948.1 aspartate carbamoyltransferase [Anaerolineaceae bacterium]HQL38560.1 aspartate carbamoyltransferase [Anaerolineaceae bacterium]HQO98294.1 aspartate carbamoyltransferase [Anaerolineaceae bacterium]
MHTPPIRRVNPHLPFGDQKGAPYYGWDILSVKQFNRNDIQYIFEVAHEMSGMVRRVGTFDLLKGKILTNLFYEPSTRTSSSFTSAMERLGGSVIPINEVRYSSVSKGESLPDTIRTLECYADVIVLRHPEMGSAALAAQYARKPLINAGDGAGEHPTQALLDLFTISEELKRLDGLTITMVGDLKYGRTVHSLARLLTLFDVKINYVSPDILRMPAEIMAEVADSDTPQAEYRDLDPVLAESDVIYVTRVQKERFENPEEYEQVKGAYVINREIMSKAKEEMIVMHPLPRVTEISMDVDDDPRAAYFRQMEYGLYTRMALLAMVLGKA